MWPRTGPERHHTQPTSISMVSCMGRDGCGINGKEYMEEGCWGRKQGMDGWMDGKRAPMGREGCGVSGKG